jgi:hypothetical protein
MRSPAIALALTSALAGCTQVQARRAHRAGEVATAGGLVGILASATTASLVPAHEDTFTAVGIAFIPVAVIGALVFISTDGRVDEDHGPTMTRRERQRAAAWELTKQAADAARGQDCTQVQAIAPRVRELDQDFHVSVFLRDVAIQRCLR